MLSNKKGGKYLSFWMILVWILIATGIAFGVSIFYAANIDVKTLEANVLLKKVADCVSDGNDVEKWVLDGKSDLMDKCDLNKNHFGDDSNYFVKVGATDYDNNRIISGFKIGNHAFEADCDVKKGLLSAKKFPNCVETNFNLLNEDELVHLEVLASSKAVGDRRKNAR
jgi:hypothetical protein